MHSWYDDAQPICTGPTCYICGKIATHYGEKPYCDYHYHCTKVWDEVDELPRVPYSIKIDINREADREKMQLINGKSRTRGFYTNLFSGKDIIGGPIISCKIDAIEIYGRKYTIGTRWARDNNNYFIKRFQSDHDPNIPIDASANESCWFSITTYANYIDDSFGVLFNGGFYSHPKIEPDVTAVYVSGMYYKIDDYNVDKIINDIQSGADKNLLDHLVKSGKYDDQTKVIIEICKRGYHDHLKHYAKSNIPEVTEIILNLYPSTPNIQYAWQVVLGRHENGFVYSERMHKILLKYVKSPNRITIRNIDSNRRELRLTDMGKCDIYKILERYRYGEISND